MAPAIKEIESECHELYTIKICVGKAGKISFIYVLHFYSGRDISPWTFSRGRETIRHGVIIIFYNIE